MIDWKSSIQQTFEYYTVDPSTWRDVKLLNTVKSCTITRDYSAETLGSASISLAESIGECYIRVYLVAIQNGIKERYPLGTFLIQTTPSSFDGKIHEVYADAYTPLIELKEKNPPLGYTILKGDNIMDAAYRIVRENVRVPVVSAACDTDIFSDFVAQADETWLSYLEALIANAKYSFELDEMSRILFTPNQSTASLQPVWTFSDDNSSILYPQLDSEQDLYGIPNVVEVIYSIGGGYYYSKVVNDDENSRTSTVNRGREIHHRVTNPNISGNPTQEQIDEYAEQLLKELSTIEQTVTYTHGYCPVRCGDCVRINYPRAGLNNVKARVISQSIKCEPGCPVTEKAVFTNKLWR